MKKLLSCFIPLLFIGIAQAQNVGVGTTTPQQKLDVNGAIKIGTTSSNQAGTIRFNTGKFEGGDGTTWKSFEGLPSKSIILARSVDTAEIKLAGFNVFRESLIDDTVQASFEINNPGQWSTLSPVNPATEPIEVFNFESVQYNNKVIFYNYDGLLYQLDVATLQWSQLPNACPLSPRFFSSMTLVGNEIFIFGGASFSPFTAYSDGAKYNLSTNTWSAVANIPVVSYDHSSCAIGTDIYIIGGASILATGGFIQLNKKFYKYNTIANSWSADLTTSNTPNSIQGNTHPWNNKLLLVGLDSVREYNPVSNSYNTLSGIINRSNPLLTSLSFMSGVVQDKVYLFGSISDTIFNSNTEPVPFQLQIDLLNGQAVSLNACNALLASTGYYYTYQYITSINKFYDKQGTIAEGKLFDPTGTSPCTVSGYFNTFLYYMKKQ